MLSSALSSVSPGSLYDNDKDTFPFGNRFTYSGLVMKRKMIGRMPAEFVMSSMMNQDFFSIFAARHMAHPFNAVSKIKIKNIPPMSALML